MHMRFARAPKIGRYYLSTGFKGASSGHLLVAIHGSWRLDFVTPKGKPGYRRIYIGPLEIEWSRAIAKAEGRS